MFKDLLKLNTMRGADSVGVLSVQSMSNNTKVFKALGTPWDAKESKGWDNVFLGWHRVLMGHNRAATRGKVSKANAHPFEFSNVIGAHNGTLTSTFNLRGHGEYPVDSEVIFHHINETSIEDAASKMQGAFALTWWDGRDSSINFIRNSQRTLSYCIFNDGATIAWASEAWMLKVASHYAGIDVGQLSDFDVADHHKIVINKRHNNNEKIKLVDEIKKSKLYVPPPVTTTGITTTNVFKSKEPVGGNHTKKSYAGSEVECRIVCSDTSNYNQHFIKATPIDDEAEIRIYAPKDGPQWKKLMHSHKNFMIYCKSYNGTYYTADLRRVDEIVNATGRQFTGFNGKTYNKEEFAKKIACNCSYCDDMVDLCDGDDLLWLDHDSFLCLQCAEDQTALNYLGRFGD